MSQAMIFRFAALLLATGVALGAFGAHALQERVTPERLEVWRTAVLYQLVHGVALLAIFAAWGMLDGGRADWGVRLLIAGVTIFSGTLYTLVITNVGWLGAITPIGGTLMIGGWLLLASATVHATRF